MRTLEWFGLYADSWQGEIVPEAFSHPAKYSRALIRKIYQHMMGQGWIKAGDKVVDPFGGVALGAYHAMQNGLVWWGHELEPKFVKLGNENIDLWNGRYSQHFTNWGSAVLLQGDSRNLANNIQGFMDLSLTSPPFRVNQSGGGLAKPDATYMKDGHKFGENHGYQNQAFTNGNLAHLQTLESDFQAAVSSPAYIDSVNKKGNGIDTSKFKGKDRDRNFGNGHSNIDIDMKYGESGGQLGSMSEGDFSAAVSSPVYGETVKNGEGTGERHDPKGHKGDNAYKATSQAAYGETNGQLGKMNSGGFEAAVSSSPFENGISADNVTAGRKELAKKLGIRVQDISPVEMEKINKLNQEYGKTNGQLGQDSGETFWTAARQIVEQTYLVLKPGAYAAWVCGDFVRNKQRVYFGRQWLQLCEAVGFETVEWAIAWKTEYKGTQLDIFGNEHEKRIDRVSFFRRLANEKNPDNAILNEDVIFVRKPL